MSSAKTGPFGNPDGSRADLEDVIRGFIPFGSSEVWGGLATASDDRTARILVGRKGSGKTVYLRRLRAAAANEHGLFADDIQQGKPQTESIIRFCEHFPPGILTERWNSLWRCAILGFVTGHILRNPEIAPNLSKENRENLESAFTALSPHNTASPVSIYSELSRLINDNPTRNTISRRLDSSDWDQLEWRIGECLKELPPLCFYIDAVDEEFEHAPMHWMQCQLGLFFCTMDFLRDHRLGGRLHICVALRDIVLAAVLRSEHRTRYRDEPHIRVLRWDIRSATHFLREKVRRLDDKLFADLPEGQGKTVANWLGYNEIRNSKRRVYEPIEQYCLRHTRLLPRDIISLGNRLCAARARHMSFHPGKPWVNTIRAVVGEAARFFGEEQFEIAANQIVANTMPTDAARRQFSASFAGNAEYAQSVSEELKELVASIGKDKFGRQELDALDVMGKQMFGDSTDIPSILWQCGLLAYADRSERRKNWHFFSEDQIDDFKIPRSKNEYAFHSTVLDCTSIKSVGTVPVVGSPPT